MSRNSTDRIEAQKDFASVLLLEKIIRDVYSSIRSNDIQPLQWSILRYLASNPKNRCTVRWISSFLGITHAPVVRSISALTKKNLVEQIKNPEDARSHIILLTSQGRETLSEDPVLSIANRVAMLPQDERDRFRETVRNLALSRGKDGGNKDA